MKKRVVGFRLSYMENDPRYNEEVAESAGTSDPVAVPELDMLRKKIAGMAVFMSTSKFAKMSKSAKLEFVLEFAELNSIENGFARAVEAGLPAPEFGNSGPVETTE